MLFSLHDFHAVKRGTVQVEGHGEVLFVGSQFRFCHLTTGDLRNQVWVIHLDNVIALCLEMEVEGWMRVDDLYQSLFHLVAVNVCWQRDGCWKIIGCVIRMLHALVIDTQLGVVEGSRQGYLVLG